MTFVASTFVIDMIDYINDFNSRREFGGGDFVEDRLKLILISKKEL